MLPPPQPQQSEYSLQLDFVLAASRLRASLIPEHVDMLVFFEQEYVIDLSY